MERIESGFRSFVERLRPSDYLAVSRDRRFRAVQRRRTREAVRVDILVVIVAFVFDAITASEHGLGVVAIDAGLIGLALVSLWSLGHWCRHHPEPVAWIMVSGVLFTMPATAFVAPSLAIQSAAYMLVLPGLVALVVPWRTRTHLAWLAMFLVVVTWYFTLDVNGALGGDVRYDLASVLLVACGASLAGRALLQRAQLRNFVQVEHIHALHRQRDDQIAQLTHVHGTLRTLGAAVQQAERRALHDPLTGLANRTLLADRLAQGLAQRGATVAVVMLDLDHFKAVNDTLGHAAGDEVLLGVAKRFMSSLRSGDTLARLSGDEFVEVVRDVKDVAVACAIAGRLLGSLRAPFELPLLGGKEVTVHASAGIALAAVGECAPEELMRRADVALYRAKKMGKDQWQLFDASMDTEAQRPLGLPTTSTAQHR